MSSPPPTIAILSIGQMGLGIASLLLAHSYRVITNVSDRSPATRARAESASLHCMDSDAELVAQADYILSIVPPRDALATALRVAAIASEKEAYFVDLNAISPRTARAVAATLPAHIKFIDGAIIGSPPSLSASHTWSKPGLPLSGPHRLPPHLATVLNARHIGDEVGKASGLKCCFAALSKGFTALALQSFTAASEMGVYDELQEYLDEYNPAGGGRARKGVVGCTGKAYRWVEEMRQIGECFGEQGGWEDRASVFREIAGVFQGLADVVEREGLEGMGDTKGVVGVLGEGLKRGEK